MLSPRLISHRIGHFRLPGVLYSVLHSPHDSCRVHEIVNQATPFFCLDSSCAASYFNRHRRSSDKALQKNCSLSKKINYNFNHKLAQNVL